MFYFAAQNRCKITSNFDTTFIFSRFFFIFFWKIPCVIYLAVHQGLMVPGIPQNKGSV